MALDSLSRRTGWRWLALALLVTTIIYWPGLSGGWLFDDYPNIVDNHGVQPESGDIRSLIGAALSSPASDFKRPLASLSFAANYLAGGLDPFGMKLTNLVIHLINGAFLFLLTRSLARSTNRAGDRVGSDTIAAFVAAAWLILPINLTSVLYVVQRMESMANAFVLLGLLGYVCARRQMMREGVKSGPFLLATFSLTIPTAIGVLAKETAVMLPLYALLIEWLLFSFRRLDGQRDFRILGLFLIVLILPLIIGLAWLIPNLLRPESWATRDFTMGTRLLTEMRVVMDYAKWTVLPLPHSLSFYHDDYMVSSGLLSPKTTASSFIGLLAMFGLLLWLRNRLPLAALGIALFLGCQLLTATVLPLELVYEHRNYFASFGLILTLAAFLNCWNASTVPMVRYVVNGLTAALLVWWLVLTTTSAYAWGDPLRLAQMLAERDTKSPRAQYELGRTYIIYSLYSPSSPYTRLAYAPLEQAAALPKSSILPQQALIFMNARMGLPLKNAWWKSMEEKLASRRPGVQDESSLAALAQCAERQECDLPQKNMQAAFEAAMSHAPPSPRLLATYASYAWNVVGDRPLGLRLQTRAADGAPHESAYLVTLIRMLVSQGQRNKAQERWEQLKGINIGGHLDVQIDSLYRQMGHAQTVPDGQGSP